MKPGELRAADQAIAAASDEANPDAMPVAGRVGELTRDIYGGLSQGGHNRRPSIRESIVVQTRAASPGPHPDPRMRAFYVAESNPAIEETVIAVGGALRRFYGTTVWTDHVKVTQRTLEAIRADQSLDEARLLHDAKI